MYITVYALIHAVLMTKTYLCVFTSADFFYIYTSFIFAKEDILSIKEVFYLCKLSEGKGQSVVIIYNSYDLLKDLIAEVKEYHICYCNYFTTGNITFYDACVILQIQIHPITIKV